MVPLTNNFWFMLLMHQEVQTLAVRGRCSSPSRHAIRIQVPGVFPLHHPQNGSAFFRPKYGSSAPRLHVCAPGVAGCSEKDSGSCLPHLLSCIKHPVALLSGLLLVSFFCIVLLTRVATLYIRPSLLSRSLALDACLYKIHFYL